MLDLKLVADADLAGVPIPVPGRVVLFAGSDGRLRGRLNGGQLVEVQTGPAGPPGQAAPVVPVVAAWSERPSASASGPGARMVVAGLSYAEFFSDGARWRPVAGALVLVQSAVPVEVTGTTNEIRLASVVVPGGLLGLNGHLRVSEKWTYTSSVNNKNFKFRLGGQVVRQYAVTSASVNNSATWSMFNRGDESLQIGGNAQAAGSGVSNAAAIATATANTAADVLFEVTAQLVQASEKITLEAWSVEVVV
jgi:hypothetical protein